MSGSTHSELYTATLLTEHWQAEIAPDNGGQLIRLRYRPTGRDILHYPANSDEYFFQPERHGIPVLFPPNRVDSGRFERNGKVYTLPITDSLFKHHIHGVVLKQPWTIEENNCQLSSKVPFDAAQPMEPATCAKQDACAAPSITLSILHDESSPSFAGYPHRFRLTQTYTFYPDTVRHSIKLENLDPQGTAPLPFGLGFHTAFRLSENGRTRLRVAAPDYYWEVNPARRLTNGNTVPWTEKETFQTPEGQILGAQQQVNRHFPSVSETIDGKPFRGAILEFPDEDARITYEIDDAFGHWYLWRPPDNMSLLCIEPMSWMVDAPNLPMPQETTGIQDLPAGEVWHTWSSIHIAPLGDGQ